MTGVDCEALRKVAAWVSRPRNSHLDTVFIAMITLAINDGFWFGVGVIAIVGVLASWALQRFAGRLLVSDDRHSHTAGEKHEG